MIRREAGDATSEIFFWKDGILYTRDPMTTMRWNKLCYQGSADELCLNWPIAYRLVAILEHQHVMQMLYTRFVDCRLVDSRFVYTLNTKTSYSWLTKPQTPKLNAKTGGSAPQNPPKLFAAGYKQLKCINSRQIGSRQIGCRRTGHNPHPASTTE